MDYTAHLDGALSRLYEEGRYRTFIDIEREKGNFPHAMWNCPDGSKKPIIVWCGNDYLGMGQHPVVLNAMHEAVDATGAGSGGTRNISGTTVYHKRLEAELADLHGKESALLFTSAYIANDATLSTLPKLFPGLIIYSDELNHASMIEGVRRNGGAKRVFRHNDVAHLRELLAADDPKAPKLIAFESVYSMDGDFGPIEAICDLADQYGAMVHHDDCHATGFMGVTGRGVHEHCGVMSRVDIITGTFGKALGGGSGGFTAGRQEIIDILRQRSRPYLFSNTLAPAICAASLKVLDMLEASTALRDTLHSNTQYFREQMQAHGFAVPAGDHPIVPVMLGDAVVAQRMSERLLELGIYAVGFFYPVVPQGKARIRVQISAGHTNDDLDRAVAAFNQAQQEIAA